MHLRWYKLGCHVCCVHVFWGAGGLSESWKADPCGSSCRQRPQRSGGEALELCPHKVEMSSCRRPDQSECKGFQLE